MPRDEGEKIAVMFTGGGARAAYQVGLLRGIAHHFPNLRFQIITGVSAGAINAMFLASRKGSLYEKAEELGRMWCELECSSIWHFDWRKLIPFRSAVSSLLRMRNTSRTHGFVDTAPLAQLLSRIFDARPNEPIQGLIDNLRSGELESVALNTLDYSTGQSVRWVQGRTADSFADPNRRSEVTDLTVEHVMASSALPFFFPAAKIGNQWHGDGGIRLAAPLSAAVHLGATRIIAMSTGYQRTPTEANTPVVDGYPPAAQVLGQLLNAIFLDAIDEDVSRMQRMSDMLRKLDPRDRGGFKPLDLIVLRPSVDLGKLAGAYEKYLPRDIKLLTRALGAKETESPDFMSMLMFEPHYTSRIMEIGEQDAEARIPELRTFLGEKRAAAVAS
jgi:NTE family protein